MKPFESDDRITEQVNAVYALTVPLDRGQILTHDQVEALLGCRRYEASWGHVLRKVRRKLEEERGISTWPDPTVGYRLCTTAEQLEIPQRRMRRALRQAKRGRKSLEALPDKSLSLHQRRAKAFLHDVVRDSEKNLRAGLRSQVDALKPTTTQPRPKARTAASPTPAGG